VKSGGSRRSRTSVVSNASVIRIREAEIRSKWELSRLEEEIEERERERMEQERQRMEQERKRMEQEREAERERDKRRLQRARELEKMKVDLERVKAEAEKDGGQSDHSQDLSEDEGEATRPAQQRHRSPRSRPTLETREVRYRNPFADTFYEPPTVEEAGVSRKFLARQTIGKDLPHFSGSPEEWPCFLAEYNQTTEACGFSKVENMSRLRKCLKGKAKETVQAALAVPDNVDEVMDMLETQYGRPDTIVKTLIHKAKEVPTIKEGKPEAIITFSNAVRNLTTSMELLGRMGHNTNPQLLEELIKKLPWGEQSMWATCREDKG
jgi:hypothetical protein